MTYFVNSLQHILAEIERIDILIRSQVARSNALGSGQDELQGLYISEQEIEILLQKPIGLPRWLAINHPLSEENVQKHLSDLAQSISARKNTSLQKNIFLRLDHLTKTFDLTPFDVDTLLICFAPCIDLRYEQFYAYLHNNITRKQASIDLVINLLCGDLETALATQSHFNPTMPLCKYRLIQLFTEVPQSSLLNTDLKLDERIRDYLLDGDALDERLLPYSRFVVPQSGLSQLILPEVIEQRLTTLISGDLFATGLFIHLQGSMGVGKRTVAEALCYEVNKALLIINGDELLKQDSARFEDTLRRIQRETLLRNTALYLDHMDLWLAAEYKTRWLTLVNWLGEVPSLVFVACETSCDLGDGVRARQWLQIKLERPVVAQQIRLWQHFSPLSPEDDHGNELVVLASKFSFTPGQIQNAALTARNLALWRDANNPSVTIEDLYAACRQQSSQQLPALARKTKPHYHWNDIVLPDDQMQQLREICNYVRYRSQVYDEWGFDKKLSLGKGLNVLFAGPSGTGKTMSAEIIANELNLDLYKIDLSSVISKFIGETEKNLAIVFNAAEHAGAILLFDEADALFGKRSEVRDSHDRYANVEISYLLQRMEEYRGIVILTTNLHKNMDEAFVRRMSFTVNFPFPAAADRRRIWENVWPDELPRKQDFDLDYLAENLEIAGGNIRNIALAAAFLAADENDSVGMSHIISAAQREYQKMGKIVTGSSFT
ncbi:MAG: AAA family ATPase [Anaerolineaceae bacterium]|nr:AAA family ATPase [Anaerolineaceae bacterium]